MTRTKTELTGEYMMAKAWEWRNQNPEAWEWAVDTAKQYVELNLRFSMDFLMHHVRFLMKTNGLSCGFKVNNNTVAGLSRMMREEHPETKPYLEVRKSKVDLK